MRALFCAHSLRSPARSGKTFAPFYYGCCLVKSARNFASCCRRHGSTASVSLRAQKKRYAIFEPFLR
ncbi:hypothetical protein [Campylobacter sp.]|uniref:hypothetical protein n=1 Tax=Campylobacter sp. TaxID=205 RepID=UPI002AA80509|nr:hypothetical protein [Campylobacter sp.]MCI7076725.1 hypothetical protein [Campylobacter sp.]